MIGERIYVLSHNAALHCITTGVRCAMDCASVCSLSEQSKCRSSSLPNNYIVIIKDSKGFNKKFTCACVAHRILSKRGATGDC
jgi:hypothetical protein